MVNYSRYIIIPSLPAVVLFTLMHIANLIPFNPYQLFLSPFIFCLIFFLSFSLIFIFMVPENGNDR